MSTDSHSDNRRLAIKLPLTVANGVTIDLDSKFTFAVSLFIENIEKCIVSVNSDTNLFVENGQEIVVEYTQKIEEKVIDIILTPTSRTVKPTWIGIIARADALVRAGGFFVTVV